MLAGGYAMCAHELLDRPSQDIDFATASILPLPVVVDRLATAFTASGFTAQGVGRRLGRVPRPGLIPSPAPA
ncbi:hypothetical protein [Micromonospora avicenniae]|uniref:hypothetical protein n=1 Tax=Micromonospora avicenniae TaxID=1198245 RepID=UPI003327C886